VKFLVAMVALGTLVAHLCFASWKRRARFMLAAVVVPVLANGVRPGARSTSPSRRARVRRGFDHIVYGWIFFALVMARCSALVALLRPLADDPLVDPARSRPRRCWRGWRVGSAAGSAAAICALRGRRMDGPHRRPAVTVARMCGIAGIFHCGTIKPVDPRRVERMCDALVHRGPDSSGVWTGPGVGLGFRPAGDHRPRRLAATDARD
jgi:exosortase/archaeosortase family protein